MVRDRVRPFLGTETWTLEMAYTFEGRRFPEDEKDEIEIIDLTMDDEEDDYIDCCIDLYTEEPLVAMFRSVHTDVAASSLNKVRNLVSMYHEKVHRRLEHFRAPKTISLLNNLESSKRFVRDMLLDGGALGPIGTYPVLGMKNVSNLDGQKTVVGVGWVEGVGWTFDSVHIGAESTLLTSFKLYSTSFLGINRENRHPPITSAFERFRWLYMNGKVDKETVDRKVQPYAKEVLSLLYNLPQTACTPSTYRVEFTIDG